MKNKILVFGVCIAVFLGMFGFTVSASPAELTVSNVYTTKGGYSFDVHVNAQSVFGFIFVARKNVNGAFVGAQVYDAKSTVEVEVSKDWASVSIFWWDISGNMKPMVEQVEVNLLNDIEDGGLL